MLLFRKWWSLLLQGLLLIILSIFIFNHPLTVLAVISLWVGLIVLIVGLLGIISWLVSDKHEKEGMPFFWSAVTFAFGLYMLINVTATMATISVIFGLWVLVSGVLLIKQGWAQKDSSSNGWAMVIFGGLSILAALMIIFNLGTAALSISTLLGLQVMLTGITLCVLAIGKKTVIGKVKHRVKHRLTVK